MANSDSDDGNDQERNFEDCLDLLREKRFSFFIVVVYALTWNEIKSF